MQGEKIILNPKTRSLCPVCLMSVDAIVSFIEGVVRIEKQCPVHGFFESPHFWSDIKLYLAMKRIAEMSTGDTQPDNLGLYLTQRCNLNCSYCYLEDSPERIQELNINEILKSISGFQGSTIILSGGEPTLREDLFDIINKIKLRGYRIILATNGISVSREYANKLKSSGLSLAMVSFTTFDNLQSKILHSINVVEAKKLAVENLEAVGIPVFLYIPVLRGKNDGEIGKFIDYAKHVNAIKAVDFNVITHPGGFSENLTLSQSEIIDLIARYTDVTPEDFIDCTFFIHLVYETLRKLFGYWGRRTSGCYLSLYFIKRDNTLMPISRSIDLKYLIKRLILVNSILDSDLSFKKFKAVLKLLVSAFVVTARIDSNNKVFFSIVLKKFIFKFFRKNNISAVSNDFLCINVMKFNDRFNIDFEFTKVCCSYSVRSLLEKPYCACIREMYFCSSCPGGTPG